MSFGKVRAPEDSRRGTKDRSRMKFNGVPMTPLSEWRGPAAACSKRSTRFSDSSKPAQVGLRVTRRLAFTELTPVLSAEAHELNLCLWKVSQDVWRRRLLCAYHLKRLV